MTENDPFCVQIYKYNLLIYIFMDKKLQYEDFVRIGIIRRLPEVEKEKYLSFHDKLWKEDFKICELLIDKSRDGR